MTLEVVSTSHFYKHPDIEGHIDILVCYLLELLVAEKGLDQVVFNVLDIPLSSP